MSFLPMSPHWEPSGRDKSVSPQEVQPNICIVIDHEHLSPHQSKKTSLYLTIRPAAFRAMRSTQLFILGSCGAGIPHSTYKRKTGTLSRKKDTKIEPYPNCFSSPLLHLASCFFILLKTPSYQLKTRGSIHSSAY
jgi:hypothetical protein